MKQMMMKQIVPDRHAELELESEHVSFECSDHVPVIDFQNLLVSSDHEMGKLHMACKDWGLFQLINHGVEEEVRGKMLSNVEQFFKLPLEEKRAYAQQPNSSQGYVHASLVTENQKLDWSEFLSLVSLPVSQKNLLLWPKSPSSFRETLERYALDMERLTFKLLRKMAKNLGVEAEKITQIFEKGTQGVRSNHYPPCPEADKVIGITPHSDASLITLLIQNNEVAGLQIKKNGSWVPIKPIPNAFIVNIGDVLEILSNGLYKSVVHRATIHPEKERISIAGFQNPRRGIHVGPLEELLDDQNGAKYETVSFDDYLSKYLSGKLDGERMLDHIKLKKCEVEVRAN